MTELEITALLARGEAALNAYDYRGAAEAFGAVGTMVPDDVTVALMTANAWRLADNALAARIVLRQVCARASGSLDVPSLFTLGGALLDTGAPEESLDCFTRVAKALPRDASALNALASAMRASGDPKGAWPVVQRALTIAPSLPAALLTAAHIRQALGDLDGAQASPKDFAEDGWGQKWALPLRPAPRGAVAFFRAPCPLSQEGLRPRMSQEPQ